MTTQQAIVHGVFLNIFSLGILITGKPGVGKSEIALELIHKGHKLIADDAPLFFKQNKQLIGSCPALLQDVLDVRGLGILNIKKLFGIHAISSATSLAIIIELKEIPIKQRQEVIFEKITATHSHYASRLTDNFKHIMGLCVPYIELTMHAGSNICILVETAVKNHILKKQGFDGSKIFKMQQQHAISEQEQ